MVALMSLDPNFPNYPKENIRARCNEHKVRGVEIKYKSADPLLTYDDASPPADPVTGAPTRSAFQTDSLGLRCRLRCSWGLRAPQLAWLSGATWSRRCTTTNSTAPSPRFTPSRTACLRSTANGWRTERRRRARL